jgi:hypothetical protein
LIHGNHSYMNISELKIWIPSKFHRIPCLF